MSWQCGPAQIDHCGAVVCYGFLSFFFFFRFHNVEDTNDVDIVSFLEDSWYNLTKFKMNTKKVKASLSRPCFNIQKRPR